jgi:hypothetical protein
VAEITKATVTRNTVAVPTASLASLVPGQDKTIVGLVAGEAINIMDACYIKSDGKVWLATGAAATAPARVRGFAMGGAAINEPVTLIHGVNVGSYAAAMTPGADLYLSGTVPGGLADAASTGGLSPIAFAISATKIRLLSLK